MTRKLERNGCGVYRGFGSMGVESWVLDFEEGDGHFRGHWEFDRGCYIKMNKDIRE